MTGSSPIFEQVYGVKEFSVATIASNGAAGGAAGALKVRINTFGATAGNKCRNEKIIRIGNRFENNLLFGVVERPIGVWLTFFG